jgi:hypothetical protein
LFSQSENGYQVLQLNDFDSECVDYDKTVELRYKNCRTQDPNDDCLACLNDTVLQLDAVDLCEDLHCNTFQGDGLTCTVCNPPDGDVFYLLDLDTGRCDAFDTADAQNGEANKSFSRCRTYHSSTGLCDACTVASDELLNGVCINEYCTQADEVNRSKCLACQNPLADDETKFSIHTQFVDGEFTCRVVTIDYGNLDYNKRFCKEYNEVGDNDFCDQCYDGYSKLDLHETDADDQVCVDDLCEISQENIFSKCLRCSIDLENGVHYISNQDFTCELNEDSDFRFCQRYGFDESETKVCLACISEDFEILDDICVPVHCVETDAMDLAECVLCKNGDGERFMLDEHNTCIDKSDDPSYSRCTKINDDGHCIDCLTNAHATLNNRCQIPNCQVAVPEDLSECRKCTNNFVDNPAINGFYVLDTVGNACELFSMADAGEKQFVRCREYSKETGVCSSCVVGSDKIDTGNVCYPANCATQDSTDKSLCDTCDNIISDPQFYVLQPLNNTCSEKGVFVEEENAYSLCHTYDPEHENEECTVCLEAEYE